MKICVVVNKASGLENARQDQILDELLRLREGLSVKRCDPDSLRRELERAAQECDAVIAGGGDGTIRTAAQVLSEAGKPLGILPLGTMNFFARLLGIPLDPGPAARAALSGHAIRVDTLTLNDRLFVSHSTLGIHPRYIRVRKSLQRHRKWKKPLAMAVATYRAITHRKKLSLVIRSDGEEKSLSTPFVLVGNSPDAINPITVHEAGREALSSGRMCVMVSRRSTTWQIYRAIFRTFMGRLDLENDFTMLELGDCLVTVDRKSVLCSLDGELMRLKPPLRFEVRPGSLEVFVAPGEDGKGTA